MSSTEYCRLCSKRSPANINIFGEQGKRHLIPLKICNIANIFITETDPLPKFVCILCIGKLNFVQNFRTECQNAQTFFRKRLRGIISESESEDDTCIDSKFKNLFGEIYDVKPEKNELKNAGSCVNDANTSDSNIENSDDMSNKVVENCKNKVTFLSNYADELAEELGVEMEVEVETEFDVKMEVEEVDSDDDFKNFENTAINSDKNDQKDCSIDEASEIRSHAPNEIVILHVESLKNKEMFVSEKQQLDDDKCNSLKNENSWSLKILKSKNENVNSNDSLDRSTSASDAQAKDDVSKHVISVSNSIKESSKINKSSDVNDVLDHKNNISQKENSKWYLEFSDSERDSNDCDDANDDSCYPTTDAAEAKDDENELVGSVSNSTDESSKINKYSEGEDMLNNGNCTHENDSRAAKMNESTPLVTTVKENLHDIDQFYFSYYGNETVRNRNELFEYSYSRYFKFFSYLINRKASVMPYFLKAMLNNKIKYMFKCFVCKRNVNAAYSGIIKHLIIHLHVTCSFCNHTSKTNTQLREHYNSLHSVQLIVEKIECKYCNKKFSDFDFYWSHIKNHVGEQCGLCEFQSKTSDLLHKHKINNHKNGKKTCTNCAVFYYDGFIDHLEHVKKLGFVCCSCKMAFHNEHHLIMHYKIYGKNHWSNEKNKNVFTSLIDNQRYRRSLTDNQRKILDPDSSNLSDAKIIDIFKYILKKKVTLKQLEGSGKSGAPICPWTGCKKKFPEREEMFIQHLQNHLLVACFKCNKCFSRGSSYKQHVLTVCKKTDFKCCVCENRIFKCINEYLSHVSDHLAKKVCKYCNVVLSGCWNEKRKHMRQVHYDLVAERVICEHCGKFFNESSLSSHFKNVHNLEGPSNLCSFCGNFVKYPQRHKCSFKPNDEKEEFICGYCSKVFHRKMSLVPHILVHMNEKSFRCSLCNKNFNRISSLTKHVKDMHAARKWACYFEDCTKAFSFQSALETHITTCHEV